MKPMPPCINDTGRCEKRVPGCQGNCAEFSEYKQNLETYKGIITKAKNDARYPMTDRRESNEIEFKRNKLRKRGRNKRYN